MVLLVSTISIQLITPITLYYSGITWYNPPSSIDQPLPHCLSWQSRKLDLQTNNFPVAQSLPPKIEPSGPLAPCAGSVLNQGFFGFILRGQVISMWEQTQRCPLPEMAMYGLATKVPACCQSQELFITRFPVNRFEPFYVILANHPNSPS